LRDRIVSIKFENNLTDRPQVTLLLSVKMARSEI